MTLSKIASILLAVSIAFLLAGALIGTFTDLGILGWALTLIGIATEVVAVTRPRAGRS